VTRLKAERLRRGWTLQVVGYKSGVQATDISKIERRLALPYPGQRKRLSRVLGCTPEKLLDEVERYEPGPEPAQVG
jgi:transcriptional regulator with XRE-family HTH domain